MSKYNKIRLIVSLTLLVISFCLYISSLNVKQINSNEITVSFLNIGQGDSIFIESPTGVQVLIDAGPDKKVLRRLSQVMPFYDKNIDIVIATHPDKDHIGGIPAVLNKYKIDMFIESGAKNENGVYDEVNKIADKLEKQNGLQRIIAHSGQSIELGGGAILKILYPDRDITGLPTNDASIVALLEYKDKSFLFTGDAPFEAEYRILKNPLLHKVSVLKVGHHGSQYSTGTLFLEKIIPDYAVISVGENKYGHPTEQVLNSLSSFNIPVLRTDKAGTIVFTTDGNTIFYKTIN